ncbi:hypothetical protein ABW636_14180 [Aquimarina sp. 2201CG1-2-11]|uniref:hypothetical protein n=1 Tax=Aquimarina discodermiae TaxID=3231043 RepID=UPI003461B3BA
MPIDYSNAVPLHILHNILHELDIDANDFMLKLSYDDPSAIVLYGKILALYLKSKELGFSSLK